MRVFNHRKLIDLREQAGLSRSELAVCVDRSYPSILKYESGAVTPPTDVLVRVAEQFDVSLDDLFVVAETAA